MEGDLKGNVGLKFSGHRALVLYVAEDTAQASKASSAAQVLDVDSCIEKRPREGLCSLMLILPGSPFAK